MSSQRQNPVTTRQGGSNETPERTSPFQVGSAPQQPRRRLSLSFSPTQFPPARSPGTMFYIL